MNVPAHIGGCFGLVLGMAYINSATETFLAGRSICKRSLQAPIKDIAGEANWCQVLVKGLKG